MGEKSKGGWQACLEWNLLAFRLTRDGIEVAWNASTCHGVLEAGAQMFVKKTWCEKWVIVGNVRNAHREAKETTVESIAEEAKDDVMVLTAIDEADEDMPARVARSLIHMVL